jgi:pSer/pThr/pTyr-binding forkhead associated (FHA) protein
MVGGRYSATLTITNGCFAGLEIPIKKKSTLLGRDKGCDICLDNSLVSSKHAVVLRTDSGFVVEDLNSRNGILVNGQKVHRQTIRNGDTISIGQFDLRFSGH